METDCSTCYTRLWVNVVLVQFSVSSYSYNQLKNISAFLHRQL